MKAKAVKELREEKWAAARRYGMNAISMNAEKLNELRDKAHAMACEKGWHETEHSDEHWLMLVITEVAEAVEAYRERGFEAWFECPDCRCELGPVPPCAICSASFGAPKPCGVGSELADVVIRLLDWAGLRGVELPLPRKMDGLGWGRSAFVKASFWVVMAIGGGSMSPGGRVLVGRRVIESCLECAAVAGIDLWAEVERKMEWNKTRPYRHGNKRA